MKKHIQQDANFESISRMWHRLFVKYRLPIDGVVVEVAPGYEPKIARALSQFKFSGVLFLVEPDQAACVHIQETYPALLPHAKIVLVSKPLHEIQTGIDIPFCVDALVASHPFDDMVISTCVTKKSFFTEEEKTKSSRTVQKVYKAITDKDYRRGVEITVTAWKNFIEVTKPHLFIVSQYPSRTLEEKGLVKRQESGFEVLDQLKDFYKDSLAKQKKLRRYGYKGDPRWWIIAKNPRVSFVDALSQSPHAFGRLGESIFVPHAMRQLKKSEYEVVYIDNDYCKRFGKYKRSRLGKEYAIVLDERKFHYKGVRCGFADRQKDKTNIGLSGNRGSGRAVYYGDRFNVLGVGKTMLCTSTLPSHSTGDVDLIGAMRRIILSHWINYFTKRASKHPILIALTKTVTRKWNHTPIHAALVVRVDDGSLDRPSHVEESPGIFVDFQNTLSEYARLDAEYFAFRFMLGAWSTSNYSLKGDIIDLESASFVRYRGPYRTSSAKYPHNLFGYEGMGFIKILYQLADVTQIRKRDIRRQFQRERQRHLARCFLRLVGIDPRVLDRFFEQHKNQVINISRQFEQVSKKIHFYTSDLNVYKYVDPKKDPTILDTSGLLRRLSDIYASPRRDEMARKIIWRKTFSSYENNPRTELSMSKVRKFLQKHLVVGSSQYKKLHQETRRFIKDIFELIDLLHREQCIGKRGDWKRRLQAMNQDLPTMFVLNKKLTYLAELYRCKHLTAHQLELEIKKLCEMPWRFRT